MASRNWLARGSMLPDGSKTRKLISCADEWQIFSTSGDGFALIVKPSLLHKWEDAQLIAPNLFSGISVGDDLYFVFVGMHGYMISSIQSGPYPNTSIEAKAFSIALRESRKLIGSLSLHDALYIEQISKLLPTYTVTESFDDQTVLGTWLSAGVSISTSSFRRLCQLLDWMNVREVKNIICEAGLPIKENGDFLKTQSDNKPIDAADETHTSNIMPLSRTSFSLPGRPYLEEFFNENVIDIVRNEDKYNKMGIGFPPAIVLYGTPGCGKTYAVDRLADFLDWPSFSIDSGSIGSPYIHDTSKKIAEVFDKAIENAPSIVVIDEMEAFLSDRNTGQSSGLYHVEEVAEFLRRIPEATKNRVLVIAMTNMIDLIDPAILRRGRFDHKVEVKMPSGEEVYQLISNMLAKLPVAEDVDMNVISGKLEGCPVSDIAFAIKEAGRIAAKLNKETIDNSALLGAIELLSPKTGIDHRKIGF